MTGATTDEERAAYEADVRELAAVFLEARRAELPALRAAVASGDLAAVRGFGHSLRGSAATFGFPEAGRLGVRLEEAAEAGDTQALPALVAALQDCLAP